MTRSALRYYGGKAALADWIIAQLPAHVCYVEPFGGGASVLLRKPPSLLEVLNDHDGEVVNFFRVLRERPDDLLRVIDLTPFARAEADLACEPDDPDRDPFERARRLYVRSWQTMHGAPRPSAQRTRLGWRFERFVDRPGTNVEAWGRTEHLAAVASRLKAVQIECDDALAVVRRFDGPDTLFYADPPYPAETRGERWGRVAYSGEMGDHDHALLAETLRGAAGMAVVSGYDCPMYRALYDDHGWSRVERAARSQSRADRTEVLWLSPTTVRRRENRQLSLLEAAG